MDRVGNENGYGMDTMQKDRHTVKGWYMYKRINTIIISLDIPGHYKVKMKMKYSTELIFGPFYSEFIICAFQAIGTMYITVYIFKKLVFHQSYHVTSSVSFFIK